jgi:anti-anti-sigma factor
MLRVEVYVLPKTMTPTVTLRCFGRLVLGWEVETLRYMAKSRTEERLILDLNGVQTVDAAGLGLLVELHCWAQRRNQELRIGNVTGSVQRLIALTNLQSVLAITSDEAELAEAADETDSRFAGREMTA